MSAVDRRAFGLAGVAAAAAVGALANRRAVRALDAADIERTPDVDRTFPVGERVDVTTSDEATIATESTGGTTDPAVVLVHGITSSRQDWGPVARRLLELGHLVVGVDQRGHGQSNPGSDGYSAERLGHDLAEVLEALDLKDVVLVGHSMGGIAAMTFALDQAEVCATRVRSMVLVATTPRAPGLIRRPSSRLIELLLGQARRRSAFRRPALARALFGRFGSTSLVDAALESALRARPREVADCAAGLVGYDVTAGLPEIAAPTHCIFGTHDMVTPASANRRIADTIPGATSTEIAGAGHLLIWTHVADIVDRIADASV